MYSNEIYFQYKVPWIAFHGLNFLVIRAIGGIYDFEKHHAFKCK